VLEDHYIKAGGMRGMHQSRGSYYLAMAEEKIEGEEPVTSRAYQPAEGGERACNSHPAT
jgi:hypothetical protein